MTSARNEARRIVLAGKRFGRTVVRTYAGDGKWSCVCDCGTHHDARSSHLREGRTKSCGCLRREVAKARATKHGMSGTPEYKTWSSMKERCSNPRHATYEYYGGLGITPCEEWLCSFLAWFADMGERPPGCSLDRINPNGNYEPGNCRWATALQQRHNRRPPKRKRRRSSLADIQAYAESLARAGGRP
jgi:hypothetical protein